MNKDINNGTSAKPRTLAERFGRAYHAFRRPRVTIIIIAVLLALFLAGLFIPQKALYTSQEQFERWSADNPLIAFVINGLKLNEIYVAPVTVVFLALFFLNLLAVLAQRAPHMLRRAYLIGGREATAGVEKVKEGPDALSVVLDGMPEESGRTVAEKAASFFRRRFWSVMTSADGRSFVAVRNRFSPLGFLLFHVSFLLCLAGGLLVMYTRFSGNLLLTEGEEFQSDIAQFRKINREPKIFHALPELRMVLLEVFPSYEGSTGTELNASIRMKYFKETFDAIVRINEPVRRGALSILPERIGISPLFILKRRGGEAVFGGYFSLNVLKGEEDSFQFPDHPYTISVRFFPDHAEVDGKPITRSMEIRNPVFHYRIEEGGRLLFDGFRRPGETVSFDALELSSGEIRYWVDFLVVREYGSFPLAAGFLLGAAGLIMRLIFYQKTVRVHVEEGDSARVLYLNGSSEYYQHMFREELNRLAAGLAAVLQERGKEREGR